MSVETDLYAALVADSGISALVGTRIYPVVLPDDLDPNTPADWPAIVYSVIDTVLIGSGNTNRCAQSRIQVDCYSPHYLTGMKAVRDAVVAFAKSRNYVFVEASDFWEKDSKLYHQPIDLFITHEV